MDNIYNGSDTVINLSEFLREYQERIKSVGEAIPETNLELESSISLDLLRHDDEVPVLPADLNRWNLCNRRNSLTIPKKAKSLKCVEERIQTWANKRAPEAITKYRTSNFCLPESEARKEEMGHLTKEEEEEEIMSNLEYVDPYSDVLVTIRVMRPIKYDPVNTRQTFKMDREIVVLGQQFLHQFRDLIACTCDTSGPFVDISKDPSADLRASDKYADKTNSGFLFIGDTLYNDTRMEGNLDYSKEIKAWAEKQPDVSELKSGTMEETRFIDLEGIRLGFPYVYQHFGACEHVFLFSDVRVITPLDNRILSDYPYLHLLNNFRNVSCDICAIYEANHSVVGSSQHVFDTVRLCAKCLSSYHYVDGKKLGEFSAYRFRK